MVIEVATAQIGDYLHLFKNITHLRIVIDTLPLAGRLWVDDLTDPSVALAGYHYIYIFAGEGTYKKVEPFLKLIPAGMSFFAEHTDLFLPYFQQYYNSKLYSYIRTSFSSRGLSKTHLLKLRSNVSHIVEKVHRNNIRDIPSEFLFFLPFTYKKMSAFLQTGLSFFTRDHRGEVVSLISALAPITNGVAEVQVNTKNGGAYRRKGYATAACTEFLLYCLEHDLDPHWDAENAVSYELALKLGYTAEEDYEVFYWA